MTALSNLVNFIKDAWLKGTDLVEDHPHFALGLLVAAVLSRLVF